MSARNNIFRKPGLKIWLKKRILFPIISLALLLVLATVILTILEKLDYIDTFRADDKVAYTSGDFLKIEKTDHGKFFVLSDHSSAPYMIKSRFPVKKSPKTFRIFITGGSFALGDPYVDPLIETPDVGDISSWLKAMLETIYPKLKFEIINASAGGQNSGRVATIAQELLSAAPDLVIVATGNNEGYVPKTRFNDKLQKWIAYRALKRSLLPEPSPDQRYFFPPQNLDTQRIENYFRENISNIVRAYKAKNKTLALATMPIHLTYNGPNPRMIGKAIPYPKGDKYIETGRELMRDGKYEEGIKSFSSSPNQAYASKYIAESFYKLKKTDLALEFYKIYVQQNPMGRTRPSYNVFIRELAQKENLLLIDLEQGMYNITNDGIFTDKFFFDNCHLTWEGYYYMALEIAKKIVDSGLVKSKSNLKLENIDAKTIIDKYGWQVLYEYSPPRWWEMNP